MPLIDPRARFRPAPYPGRDQALSILVNPEDINEKCVVYNQVSAEDYLVKITDIPDETLADMNRHNTSTPTPVPSQLYSA